MNTSDLPFSHSRATLMLREALTTYTASHKGGLRALSAKLEMRPATVFSHMSNGRMAIPLDRADQLASVLGIDRAAFCLAVLEQRAPSAYYAIDEVTGLGSVGANIPASMRAVLQVLPAGSVKDDELVELIRRAATSAHPLKHWIEGEEFELIADVRRLSGGRLNAADRRRIGELIEVVLKGY
ncbi:hypothetical protein [Novosphingobium sp.]|uniref:hypothetical protein n=1 Tax=Novosphingobium sp. TaxID=1874826 RepID=UPI0026133B95|nr:hypothetical protein [Novosphingobium sp.]